MKAEIRLPGAPGGPEPAPEVRGPNLKYVLRVKVASARTMTHASTVVPAWLPVTEF